jgi:arylsulfatase A-like enzyme
MTTTRNPHGGPPGHGGTPPGQSRPPGGEQPEGGVTPEEGEHAKTRPNIVFILADNYGCGEPGCYGGGITRGAPTPRQDQLAAEGLRLTNFCVEAQCTPSRSAIITGRHPIRSGTHSVPIGGFEKDGLTTWERTIADVLSDAGYATAAYGKWHLGSIDRRLPHRRGFGEWYGIPRSTDECFWPSDAAAIASGVQMTRILEGTGEGTRELGVYDFDARRLIDTEATDRAIAFIERQAREGRPFYVYLALTETHLPTLPHPDFAGVTGNGDFADAKAELDAHVGEVMAAVDRAGVAGDTIVIFTSDNGPDPTFPWHGSSGMWSGYYFTQGEGSSRVPFIIRWPGKIPAGAVSNELMHEVDTFTTLALWAGAEIPDDRAIDGLDQRQFLTDGHGSARDGMLIFVGKDLRSIVSGDYKLNMYSKARDWWSPTGKTTMPHIIHLPSDPREEYPDLTLRMSWLADRFNAQAERFIETLKTDFPIRAGTPDPYTPPSRPPAWTAALIEQIEASAFGFD